MYFIYVNVEEIWVIWLRKKSFLLIFIIRFIVKVILVLVILFRFVSNVMRIDGIFFYLNVR